MADQQFDAVDCGLGGFDQPGVALGGPQPQGFLKVGAGRREAALFHEVLAEVLQGEVHEFRVLASGAVQGPSVEHVSVLRLTRVAVRVAKIELGGDDSPGVATGFCQVERLPQEHACVVVVAQAQQADAGPPGQDAGPGDVRTFGERLEFLADLLYGGGQLVVVGGDHAQVLIVRDEVLEHSSSPFSGSRSGRRC